jgi:hypothetical protein
MPAVVRCKLCGEDHPYAKYAEGGVCQNDECEAPLKPENVRVIMNPRDVRQADPLEGM